MLGALGQGQGAQRLLAGVAFLLIAGAVPGAGKGQVVAAGEHGPWIAQVLLAPANQRRAHPLRQAVPDCAFACRGQLQVPEMLRQVG